VLSQDYNETDDQSDIWKLRPGFQENGKAQDCISEDQKVTIKNYKNIESDTVGLFTERQSTC